MYGAMSFHVGNLAGTEIARVPRMATVRYPGRSRDSPGCGETGPSQPPQGDGLHWDAAGAADDADVLD